MQESNPFVWRPLPAPPRGLLQAVSRNIRTTCPQLFQKPGITAEWQLHDPLCFMAGPFQSLQIHMPWVPKWSAVPTNCVLSPIGCLLWLGWGGLSSAAQAGWTPIFSSSCKPYRDGGKSPVGASEPYSLPQTGAGIQEFILPGGPSSFQHEAGDGWSFPCQEKIESFLRGSEGLCHLEKSELSFQPPHRDRPFWEGPSSLPLLLQPVKASPVRVREMRSNWNL